MILLSKQKQLLALVLAIAAVGIVITLFIIFNRSHAEVTHRAAVVTNGIECSDITSQILREGGSAADAAITALLCEGVTCPQSTGLGGGFVMTLYTKATGKVETLIARDVAPLLATENMFVNDSAVVGGRSISVPGELKGYWELHQKYGKLEWSRLFKPIIELCRNGHIVSAYLGRILQKGKSHILNSPSLSDVFINPKTNDVYEIGQYIKREKLAETLELIAAKGADTLYNNGTLAQRLVDDIKKEGGIVSIQDLMEYQVRWETPLLTKLRNNKTMHTLSLPGTGSMIAFTLNVLNGYLPDGASIKSFQRIAETFKYAYAKRTELGDGRFVKEALEVVQNLTDLEFARKIRNLIDDNQTFNNYSHYGARFDLIDDQGTAHINILAPNGDAISATASINNLFGSKIRSRQTGIILNDGMDDFSVPGRSNAYGLPPSPANFITPKKMPLSSMCPTILLDEHGNVDLLIGAAGGSKITSSIAYVLLRYLYFNESVLNAVNAPRIHHQLLPMRIEYEDGLSKELIDGLHKLGHEMHKGPSDMGFASLTAIGRDGNKLIPVYDPRRLGSSSVF